MTKQMTTEEMLKKCSEKLLEIADNVLADDRKAAMEKLEIGYWTIHRYLKGEVKNLDLGVNMFEFLNGRIEKRREVLTA